MKNKLMMAMVFAAMVNSFTAQSALTLSATRYVYTSDTKAIPIKVTNHAQSPYGAQIWLENVNEGESIPFSVSPGVFTLKANKGAQTVQVAQLEANATTLPQDRESLFLVHLQEIPPKAKDTLGKNILVMATRSVVKLFYRPAALNDGRENAEQNITVSKKGHVLTFTNPTPYYFALISVNGDAELATAQFNKMAPFAQATLEIPNLASGGVSFNAVDDYGGIREFHCDLNKQQQQCHYVNTK